MDVHHHMIPQRYLQAVGAEAIGRLLVSGRAPEWTPEISLAAMDRNGILKAYTSMSAPGISGFGEDETADIVRAFNDDAGRMRCNHPERFGTFSYLPLPYTELAVREINRVYDDVGTDGICLLTSYGDRYIGDPEFLPIFETLNARQAVVFVHPDSGPCACHIEGVPAATLEFPFDTTRAILSLLMNRVFQQFPDIRFIFSHAGGAVPFLAERLSRLERIPKNQEILKDGVINLLSRQYFDTALSANKYAFSALLELVDHSHILFGSDYPFAPEDTMDATIKGLAELSLSSSQLFAIEQGNALSLLSPGLVPATVEG
ncbi:MAG: amidohydrolase family protein [Arenicellales bacterium]|nr:amidohydrolase family protein [Arenicellales bacterium]